MLLCVGGGEGGGAAEGDLAYARAIHAALDAKVDDALGFERWCMAYIWSASPSPRRGTVDAKTETDVVHADGASLNH